MKILDKERMVKLGIQALVKSEIGIWKELVHPHIVRLREVLASDKQIFIVLEYAGGGEVFERVVAQGKLGEPEAREYFSQLLEALAYLHSKGVVHRDLKDECCLFFLDHILTVSLVVGYRNVLLLGYFTLLYFAAGELAALCIRSGEAGGFRLCCAAGRADEGGAMPAGGLAQLYGP